MCVAKVLKSAVPVVVIAPTTTLYIVLSLTRGAWAATGYSSLSVCLFVCDWLFYLPGCYSTAFTAWIAFTQQYLGLNSGRFLC